MGYLSFSANNRKLKFGTFFDVSANDRKSKFGTFFSKCPSTIEGRNWYLFRTPHPKIEFLLPMESRHVSRNAPGSRHTRSHVCFEPFAVSLLQKVLAENGLNLFKE